MVNVCSDLSANVWKITISEGDAVSEGDVLVILESMKMEIPVVAPSTGTVKQVCVKEGDIVDEGDVLAVVE